MASVEAFTGVADDPRPARSQIRRAPRRVGLWEVPYNQAPVKIPSLA
jgi:hypothetical protein